ncbi:uncharacterized protein FIBRA_05135 [Fibroporia radiculosa]|uniref:F-box domain-containing protein n=1 Tax=Fibroporia radiculosa TaxID=599839 RepID=J4G8M0_9APHY|nr:uncharacterized protein FIBRA_05135 [Fibroporia radiculosa]CCM03018.1 predicted protein [Fibroporia radiculosa]
MGFKLDIQWKTKSRKDGHVNEETQHGGFVKSILRLGRRILQNSMSKFASPRVRADQSLTPEHKDLEPVCDNPHAPELLDETPGKIDDTQQRHVSTLPKQPLQFPFEIWEQMVNHLAREEQPSQACILQCNVRNLRTLWQLPGHVVLRDVAQVLRMAQLLKEHPHVVHDITAVSFRDAVNLLEPFAHCMVHRLTGIEVLKFSHSRWKENLLRTEQFTHLQATFRSVTRLELHSVHFSSMALFGQLISALPCLTSLVCYRVQMRRTPGYLTPPQHVTLTHLEVYASSDVLEFLIVSSFGTILKHIVFKLLRVHEADLSTGRIQRLLNTTRGFLSEIEIWFHDRLLDGVLHNKYLLIARIDVNFVQTTDPYLNLHLDNLNIVNLSLIFEGHIPWTPYWRCVLSVLSRCTPKLCEIRIVFRTTSHPAFSNPTFEELLADADSELHARIDDLLCTPPFASLKRVILELRVLVCPEVSHRLGNIPQEADWCAALSAHLPLLHGKGILMPLVSAEEER